MYRLLPLFAFGLAMVALAGCTTGTDRPGKGNAGAPAVEDSTDKEIRAELAKLDPEDRKLAEAQRWCAVQTKSRLGSMDVPVKIMIKGQPVFLCCGGCEARAKKDEDKTLATVEELKKKAAASTP
jgi:hypothetical protein